MSLDRTIWTVLFAGFLGLIVGYASVVLVWFFYHDRKRECAGSDVVDGALNENGIMNAGNRNFLRLRTLCTRRLEQRKRALGM